MKITVIGAGNSGLAMAAHLALADNEVILWNRSPDNIALLKETKTIIVSGQIAGRAKLAEVTSDLEAALKDPDLILVTTPATAHRDLAILIGRTLKREATIILNPGRTLGALEFSHYYHLQNNPVTPVIAETQTSVYTCRKQDQDKVKIMAIKDSVYLAGLGGAINQEIVEMLPACIREHFIPAESMIQTSIGNVGMILHSTPLLLNSGWTENPNFNFKYYTDSITPHIAAFIEQIDEERLQVAEALGYIIDSTKVWFHRSYHTDLKEGDNLYDVISRTNAYNDIDAPSTLHHRYILEDIPYGLVPLESLAHTMEVDTSNTSLIIDLASKMLRIDFRATGRNLKGINLQGIYTALLREDFQKTLRSRSQEFS